ncbi:MAG: ATP synthase F0 subunit B [Candidatus Terrybacteria bacterium CG10_big_fil_rev_8_21_14_0_10_41_10]|uniref:ATP synthase subunit b n=1 Tax=Candidatus Terrybacteria bacterium CG10_big_fil_rev_8_21_14_0_10_41_10 TaxID=1975026 RepID=A0A2M8LBH1_9BACT|nr:MAG: ATP synthase F0 subunit B [Candidatus Terrybacteria bacterium CG10_big_fil_rev_8_21_14_0_10_41_10]
MDFAEILSKIGFDWKLALANLINFLIIFYLLKKFAFAPIGRIIRERKDKIDEGLENAARSEEILNASKKKSDEIIAGAKEEANKIIAKGYEQARQSIEHAALEAMKKQEEILLRAQKGIDRERISMEARVREEAAELVAGGVKKIIKEDITPAVKKNILEKVTS